MNIPQPPGYFLLSVFDREQWCPVIEARFEVIDLNGLRTMIGVVGNDDQDLDLTYYLEETEAAAVAAAFGIGLDISALDLPGCEFTISRPHKIRSAPYLIHTEYELPLLLDGRKKLARMSDVYPPVDFAGEDRFDHWVAAGILHKEVVVEPFPDGTNHPKGYLGLRTVHYTPNGEEWRIPAMKLIWTAASKSGGWNEYFERLEGMLFGYEDWQNDWWINTGIDGGGFRGLRLCCAIDEAGLAWMAAAGFQALPPMDNPTLTLTRYDASASEEELAAMAAGTNSVAIAIFRVRIGSEQQALFNIADDPPWHLPAQRIPQLNKLLREPVTLKHRRDGKS
jgi:hypothetical protein